MSTEPAQTADDVELTIRVTLTEFNVVLAHLGRGAYQDVAGVLHKMVDQVHPQVLEHQQRAVLAAVPAVSEQRN